MQWAKRRYEKQYLGSLHCKVINPYTLSFNGYKERFINFISPDDTIEGLYNRIAYQNERLLKKLHDYKHRLWSQSHHRKKDLQSYKRHYIKFEEYKNKLLNEFSEQEIENTMAKSRQVGWASEIASWVNVKTPEAVSTLPVPHKGERPVWDGDYLLHSNH